MKKMAQTEGGSSLNAVASVSLSLLRVISLPLPFPFPFPPRLQYSLSLLASFSKSNPNSRPWPSQQRLSSISVSLSLANTSNAETGNGNKNSLPAPALTVAAAETANGKNNSLPAPASPLSQLNNNNKLLQVVLVSPQIPGNAGCIARTCAASAVALHLVGPLGFKVDDTKLKRAGLDYWPYVVVRVHSSWAEFQSYFKQQKGNKRLLAFTKRGTAIHSPDTDRMPVEEKADFSLKKTKPNFGGRISGREKLTSSFDLVEEMHFLFVRVVKARDLACNSARRTSDPFVEIKIGNYKGTTKYLEKKPNPEWNQVFAFRKDRIQTLSVEITVREDELVNDGSIGKITINMSDIPTRVPPDSPLAPQWYKLEKDGVNMTPSSGELMLVIWFGTQADEVFPDAWHSDVATVSGETIMNTRSMVYLSPRLWYLRVNIVEGQVLMPRDKKTMPKVYVKATLGNVNLRTRVSPDNSGNPRWNEDLMFVTAEPFYDPLILTVEHNLGYNNQEESLGRCVIHLSKVYRRWLPEAVGAKWYNLEKVSVEGGLGEVNERLNFASKLNTRISLDGGYHVFDESIHCSSDYRATFKALWTPPIGILELGIIGASVLVPMKSRDGHETTDAYCVAKYGPKWVRTRTAVGSLSPKWNEQFNWEVYDPYTVLIIGIFDDCHLNGENMNMLGGPKDPSIGKLRIRLSTLLTNRIYTYSYPLIAMQPSGTKKMGEIQLAVRFTCPSYTSLLAAYARPLLPKMHYTHPLSVYQLNSLRQQATVILSLRLSRTEPPLRKEVVECILDAGYQTWSPRRGKANLQRLMAATNVFVESWKWFDKIRKWKNPAANVLLLLCYLVVMFYLYLILPTLLSYCFLIGIWQYGKRPQNPPHIDIKLSLADSTNADEWDEEFDTFPSSRQGDVLRMRYDRLRSMAARAMNMAGDLATQGERFSSLWSWQDPMATAIFMAFCLIAAIILCFRMIPPRFILVLGGLFVMRPPIFGIDIPSVPRNLFRRLPTRTDCML